MLGIRQDQWESFLNDAEMFQKATKINSTDSIYEQNLDIFLEEVKTNISANDSDF